MAQAQAMAVVLWMIGAGGEDGADDSRGNNGRVGGDEGT